MANMKGNGRDRNAPVAGNGESRVRPASNGDAEGGGPTAPDTGMYLVYEFERRAYPLRQDFTIGRDTASDLVVPEPTVSRTHARVNAQDTSYFLENIGATGTRVNGIRMEQAHQLAYGDRIEIGTAVLTVRTNPLPLGVSLERRHTDSLDAIAARRPTIRHPLMSERIVERPRAWGKWIAVAIAVAITAGLFLRG